MTSFQEKGKEHPEYHLTLYIAGNEQNSLLAIRNLKDICAGVPTEQCILEVIDVYKNFQRALKDRVIVTPTLIVVTENPATKATFYGTLNDKSILLEYLKDKAFANE
jgi:circadian clock protein KaiB